MAADSFDFKTFLSDYIAKVKEIVMTPQAFFDKMPTKGGFNEPLMFILPAAVVYGLGMILTGHGFASLIFGIIITYVGVFIGSVIIHIVAVILKGIGTYEATFRVGAYSSVIYLVYWFPILGGLLALYGLVLWFFGIRKVHSFSSEKTIVVLIIPIAILFVLGASLVAMFGLAFLGMGRW